MLAPILETKRMILRPPVLSDAETMFKGWTSDADVSRYMRYACHESVSVTEAWLRDVVENEPSGKNVTWAFVHKDTGEVFGSGGLVFNEEIGVYDIGYNIMRKYWNQGFTTEAMEKIIEYAFSLLGIEKLYGRHAKENVASGMVLKKLGFVYVQDGQYSKFDGSEVFATHEYVLEREVFFSKSMH